jgi:uncharacterized protein YciI
MLYILRFTNKSNMDELRTKLLSAHLAWLDQHRDKVLLPGATRANPQAPATGGLWIIEATSNEEAEAVFRTDPFWVQGLRAGYEVLHFTKAFPDRTTPI